MHGGHTLEPPAGPCLGRAHVHRNAAHSFHESEARFVGAIIAHEHWHPTGERRLSDFLRWESAYAELWFTETKWPDFTDDEFLRALADYATRERRFGGLSLPAADRKSVV